MRPLTNTENHYLGEGIFQFYLQPPQLLHGLLFSTAGILHLGLGFLQFCFQLLLRRHGLRPLTPLLLQLDLQLPHLAKKENIGTIVSGLKKDRSERTPSEVSSLYLFA